MRKTVDEIKTCMICGDYFAVRIRKSDRKIMSKCFHGSLPKHLFRGWTYEWLGGDDLLNTKVLWKNNFWKIIALTKLQRWIIYSIWKLFHRGRIEYWECRECCGR